EKSKKRQLGKPKTDTVPDKKPAHKLTEPIPRTLKPKGMVREAYSRENAKQERYEPIEVPLDLSKAYQDLPEKKEIEALKKSKMISQESQQTLKRLHTLEDTSEDDHVNEDFPQFNFRDAIIMNAILE